MSAFQNALKNYKSGNATAAPVNPPEAVKVMETQTKPEIESPKAGAAVTAVSLPASSAPAPAAAEPPKRTRRTKAEMEAARAASTPKAEDEPTGKTDSSSPVDSVLSLDDFTNEELVAELRSRGLGVTAVKQY
jgi:hypothetical protein